MAYESGAKVIPVAIKGSFILMPRTAKLPSSNKQIFVSIGSALEVSPVIDNVREREMDLMRRAEDAVRLMLS